MLLGLMLSNEAQCLILGAINKVIFGSHRDIGTLTKMVLVAISLYSSGGLNGCGWPPGGYLYDLRSFKTTKRRYEGLRG